MKKETKKSSMLKTTKNKPTKNVESDSIRKMRYPSQQIYCLE